jgi:hypothetical protein
LIAVENIQVGGPDGLKLIDQFGNFLEVDLNSNEIFVEQLCHMHVQVRHGTQFGTARSAVLEKIEKQRLFLVAGTPHSLLIVVYPTNFIFLHFIFLTFFCFSWVRTIIASSRIR